MTEVALVTGARRGIGLATAIALGSRGMRVAATSRAGAAIGAMEATVQAVEKAGGEALALPLDLSDRDSIDACVARVRDELGPISVLVNNALCEQAGSQTRLDQMNIDAFERMVVGEVVNTTYLTRQVLATGDGRVTVVNVGSGAADHVPSRPVDRGGWAFSYSATKAAVHRLAPFVQLEYGERVRAFTVDPGYIRTEALLEKLGDVPGAAPPALPAEVIAWLVLDPAADAHAGGLVHAQELAERLGLRS